MKDYEEILKLIEGVSGPDMAAHEVISRLDEIDVRVGCCLMRREWGGWHDKERTTTGSWLMRDGSRVENSYINHGSWPKYTRSRDALKAIRPEGWAWSISISDCEVSVCRAGTVIKAEAETETLAELHAIIQAIAYERDAG